MSLERLSVTLLLLFFFGSLDANQRPVNRDINKCALFRDPSLFYVKENGPSYIKLDQYDFTGDLDVIMWVLPDKRLHDGPLFSMGSEDNFKYYEWKTKAAETQYFVVEIMHGAVSMLMKAIGTEHLHQMELFTTYPHKYDIATGDWQLIHAYRVEGEWVLSLNDTIEVTQKTQKSSDVNLYMRNGFLGGRPDYESNVFRGIIRDLRVNGEPVRLTGREMAGNAEVHNCHSSVVKDFAAEITAEPIDTGRGGRRRGRKKMF